MGDGGGDGSMDLEGDEPPSRALLILGDLYLIRLAEAADLLPSESSDSFPPPENRMSSSSESEPAWRASS